MTVLYCTVLYCTVCRKLSMTDYDVPNIRRLSLTPRDTGEEADERNFLNPELWATRRNSGHQ